jgi:hypothetical protein
LSKKYGIKLIGARGVPNEHLNVVIMEAANFEVLQKVSMELEVTAMHPYNIIWVKTGLNREESENIFRQMR